MRLVLLALALAAAAQAQPKKIVVTGRAASFIPDMKTIAPDVTFVESKEDAAVAVISDADAIIGHVTPDIVRAGKKLKWVHIFSAGVERYRFPELLNSDIVLTNGRVIQGPEIADHALALLLTLTRGIDQAVMNRPKQEWYKDSAKAIELRGKTALVVGVGGIGTQIAERAHAFGMTVIGVDPKDIPIQGAISQVVKPDRIDSVIGKADVVFISAPHTPQSERMIGPKQFDLMKRGAYFVAVSRGKLYDTNSLVKALDSKKLSGAGLDVTDPEPLPKGHALWNFDNVIITPHIATLSDQVGARFREVILENVGRFAKGEPLRNVVDKVKGY